MQFVLAPLDLAALRGDLKAKGFGLFKPLNIKSNVIAASTESKTLFRLTKL